MLNAGVRILRHDMLDSTQLQARRLLDSGAQPLPFAVVAREQTAGRGRHARSWSSPRGGLWVTSAWPIPAEPDPALGLRLGLAALDAIAASLPAAIAARLELKWPNDVMIDDRKVAGVLTETVAQSPGGRTVLVGVGVNANFDPAALPEPLRGASVALRELVDADVDLESLLHALLDRQSVAISTPEPIPAIVAIATARLHRRGERATLLRPDGSTATGMLAGLDDRAEPILLDERSARIPGPFTGFAPQTGDPPASAGPRE